MSQGAGIIADLGTRTATQISYFHDLIRVLPRVRPVALKKPAAIIRIHPKFRNRITPERNDRSFMRGSDMHEAGIIGYNQFGPSYEISRFVQSEFSAGIINLDFI